MTDFWDAKRTGNGKSGMEEFYIPTHVAMKLRHGWGTRSFVVGLEGRADCGWVG
jgi:hypothetical protein